MQMIKFDPKEKEQIVSYLQEKKSSYEKYLREYERQIVVLNMYLLQIKDKTNQNYTVYASQLAQIEGRKAIHTLAAKRTERFIIKIQNGDNNIFGTEKDLLKDLLLKESLQMKNFEHKFQYYPRLKKMKEKVLYAFAHKIKVLMEEKDVQFA